MSFNKNDKKSIVQLLIQEIGYKYRYIYKSESCAAVHVYQIFRTEK
jgi:hypothetical protein